MPTPMRPFSVPVIGIAGWKNSGKTTLACRLIEEFTARGLRVASIKHAHHAFQIDDGDTDSARHRRHGSRKVAIVSATRVAVVSELEAGDEPDLPDVVAAVAPADLVVIEGYKSAAIPKIEARRATASSQQQLALTDPVVIAIASDDPAAVRQPNPPRATFNLDDIAAIADHITAAIGPLGHGHPALTARSTS